MKYFFILGRNPELSAAEIRSYLETYHKFDNILHSGNVLIVSLPEKLPEEIIKKLGGTILLGEILTEGNFNQIKRYLNETEIYFGKKNNFAYSMWNFTDENHYEEILDILKQRFKDEKLKATRKNLTGILNLQSGDKIQIPSSVLDEEFMILSNKDLFFFGRATGKSDYSDIEDRDINKPVRRESLAISPRMAKMMINLSGVKKDEKLVDPFCGVGAILQEALLQNIQVMGIDKDPQAIDGAKKNLQWAKFNSSRYLLLNSDSSTVEIPLSQVIVTEPDLGKILRQVPEYEELKETLKHYENLMIRVLKNMKNKIKFRIVFTAPYILKSKKERIGCNIDRILKETGLKIKKGFPISEIRENQIVGRQVFVLEK